MPISKLLADVLKHLELRQQLSIIFCTLFLFEIVVKHGLSCFISLNYLLIHLELHQQLSIIFSTLFLIFEIVVKPSLSLFIHHLITYLYTLNFVNNCTPNFQVCS